MWYNNKAVVSVYAHVNSKTAYAIIEGVSGWKLLKQTSTDGVTNTLALLNNAKVTGKKVTVFIDDDNKIVAVYSA